MRFILIANNQEINLDIINKINIKKEDIIILFNHHFPIKFDIIKNHRNKILFMRYLLSTKELLGFNQYLINKIYFRLVLSYYPDSNNNINIRKQFYEKFQEVINQKLLINDFIDYIKSSNKYHLNKIYATFSTGFLGYLFAKYYSRNHLNEIFNCKIEKEKIILVGFTGVYPETEFNPYHEFNLEQKYYKIDEEKKNLEFINPNIVYNNESLKSIINYFIKDPELNNYIYPLNQVIDPIIELKKIENEDLENNNGKNINKLENKNISNIKKITIQKKNIKTKK